ncbi:MAG TPA: RNA ligase family protein [Bryobacteraceae bacterium]|nr:RNA ligase family protein [Bryobacteraceae bacterium]
MIEILKYPRTPHISGSRIQPGDQDLNEIAREALDGLALVVEEKLDGSNCGISFDEHGALVLQSRGHALTGGARERQFDLLKRWTSYHAATLLNLLGLRYVMYGEWLYARHTIAYDQLPHYFLEFDVFDRERDEFLSTEGRRVLLAGSPVVPVPVLVEGRAANLEKYVGRSRCSSSETMEGLYIKHEDGRRVIGRYKLVRASFLQVVKDSGEHWMDRPIEPNCLREGVDLFS